MAAGKSLLKGLIIVIIGALLGTMVGELLGAFLPESGVKNFFLKSITFGLDPATLNLHILTLTFGLILKINVLTVIGIIGAALLLHKL
jgi:purine-cytosine permease-like protein